MNSVEVLGTVFDGVLVVLVLLGIKYEPALSEWEERLFYKLLDKFKRR